MATTVLSGRPWQDVDGPSLAACAAALQLLPQNIPRLLRLQRLAAIGAALPHRPNAVRLSPSKLRALLKDPLVSSSTVRAQEDPYDDLYIAEVPFHGGPYLVAQGLTSHAAHTLTLLLTAALGPVGRTELPAAFVRDARRLAGGVLALSDAMLRRAQLGRGVTPPSSQSGEVFVPGAGTLTLLQGAIRFSASDLATFLPTAAIEALNVLAIRPGQHKLTQEPGPDTGLVLTPLLASESHLIVANPGELAASIRHHLLVGAGQHDCGPALARLFHEQVLHETGQLLALHGATPLAPATQLGDLPVNRRRFAFADNKILDLAVVTDDFSNYDDTDPFGYWHTGGIDRQVQDTLDPEGPAGPDDGRTLRLIVNEGIGRSTVFGLTTQRRPGPMLLASLSDLRAMAELDGSDPLFLWRFADAANRFREETHVQAWSTLDVYGLYRDHHHSFYLSDGPRANFVYVEPDFSASLRLEAHARYDHHSVPSPHRRTLVPVLSVHGTRTASIYRTHPALPEDELLVEADGVHAWVGPGQQPVPETLGDFHDLAISAAAFWIWQIGSTEPALVRDAADSSTLYLSLTFDDPDAWNRVLHANENAGADSQQPWTTVRAARPGHVHLSLQACGAASLLSNGNQADRLLLKALIEGFTQAASTSYDVDALLDRLAPLGSKQMLHVRRDPHPSLRPGSLPPVRPVQAAVSATVLDELGQWLAADGTASGDVPADERTELLNKVVGHYFRLIETTVASLSAEGLVHDLVERHEALLHDDAISREMLPARIACFGANSQPVEELVRQEKKRVEAAQANRFLIEYVAARPPSGAVPLTLDTYDHLMALAAELISRATLSDAIRQDFSDAKLALLPSGRLGVSRDDRYESGTNALATARAQAVLNVAQGEGRTAHDGSLNGPTDQVEEAMRAEFGFTLSDVMDGIGALTALGDERCNTEPYILPEPEVTNHLRTALSWPRDKTESFLDRMTLQPRDRFLAPGSDAWPWRFNREWSYARRPLVRIQAGDGPHLIWGVRHLWNSAAYWRDLVYSGRLRATSRPMKKLLGAIRQDQNKAFEERVAGTLRSAGCPITARGVAKIAGRKIMSADGSDLGDIDAIGLSLSQRVVIVAEAKDFEMARNPIEMANEADSLLRGDKSALVKLTRRAQWVQQHLASVLVHFDVAGGTKGWSVAPVIVTSRDLLSPRVLAASLPVVPLVEFERWTVHHLGVTARNR
ncbi:hypothetical protein [Kitasatospora herbaricolor]|uniref:hypothetical protein n=1 Tax=Kitasatospora herbaricolor TaxID=68217 RepID=UPI0036DC880E